MRRYYNRELKNLQDNILQMGSMVNAAVGQAMQALKERDKALAQRVIANDAALNELRFQVEAEVIALIAKQQPVARDLRMIISALTLVLELERMGDHAAGIAKIAVETGSQPPLKPLIDLPRMAETAQTMLQQALNAFVSGDEDLANKVALMDDEVDALYRQVFRELLTFMIEDPRTITRAMYLLFVGHNLERIADRVTNICERVSFLNTGAMEEVPGDSSIVSFGG